MEKYLKILISLGLLVTLMTGCASYGPEFRPQGQTYQSKPTSVYQPVSSKNQQMEIFGEMARQSKRIPQQDAFSVRWFVEDKRGALDRFGCEISIQPGGSLTAGVYPCGEVQAVGGSLSGDRTVVFRDPNYGTQTINLNQMDGGYIQSGPCDRGWYRDSKSTFEVRWSTNQTIRGPKSKGGRFLKSIFDTCEPASRDMLKLAKRQQQSHQRIGEQKLRNQVNLERRRLRLQAKLEEAKMKIEADEELERFYEEVRNR